MVLNFLELKLKKVFAVERLSVSSFPTHNSLEKLIPSHLLYSETFKVLLSRFSEITRVREKLFHLNESYKKSENELPEPTGTITTLQEKVFVPVKENPNVSFC